FDAVILVFEAGVAGVRGQAAGAGSGGGGCTGGELAGGMREPGAARVGAGSPCLDRRELDLPDGLEAAGGVNAHGGVDEVGVFDVGDGALPDVEIGEVRCGQVDGEFGVGKPGLLQEVDGALGWAGCGGGGRLGSVGQLGQCRIPDSGGGVAVIFSLQTIDIHTPGADRDGVAAVGGDGDLKGMGCRGGVGGGPEGVEGSGLGAAGGKGKAPVSVGGEAER